MKRTALPVLALPVLALAALCGCGAQRPAASEAAAAATSAPSSPTAVPAAPTAAYPLTGLPALDAGRAGRPALSIKIDNIAQALPQSGLNSADLVTEALVEGGLTRLLATYQSNDAALIGPIRSARPVDADLLRELGGGIFAYSGAAPGEIAPSIAHSSALLISNDHAPQWFWRSASRAAPHNVFSSTRLLYRAGAHLRPHMAPAPRLFGYSPVAPTGRPVSSVRLPFSPISSAAWTWNGQTYSRTQDGRPDVLADGSRITSTNVVVLSVTWRRTNIIDAAGNADPYDIVVGSGKAWVLRDGVAVAAHWVRPSYRVPVRLTDASGQPVLLAPGRTWIELQPQPYRPAFG